MRKWVARYKAEGIEGLRLDGEYRGIAVESGQVTEIVVRLQADPSRLTRRSSDVTFRVEAEDNAKLVDSEEAKFLGPVLR